jgi:hypothetical protein
MILELFRRARAIPSSNEFWCLPEMDVNNSDPEEDGKLLQLMIAGEERGLRRSTRTLKLDTSGLASDASCPLIRWADNKTIRNP